MKDDTISRQAAIDAVKHAWAKGLEPTQYLEELPAVQTCDDAVSRQQAIDAVLRSEALVRAYGYRYAADAVRELPAVQPQRTGKWIECNPQNSSDCRLIECSECGNAYIVGYNIDYDDWIDGRNFCMKCGADLRGGSNGKNT